MIDELSAPLLPLVSLLYLLTVLATLAHQGSPIVVRCLAYGPGNPLATFSCMETWPLIILLAVGIDSAGR